MIGILWFFGNLLVESSILPLAVIFEHRAYLPSTFLILGAVATVARRVPSRGAAITGFCVPDGRPGLLDPPAQPGLA